MLIRGRYVGVARQEEDSDPFVEKMLRLVVQLKERQIDAAKLDIAIWNNMQDLGYGL